MFLRVDYLIYFYMLLCACMLFFNLYYVGKNRWLRMRSPRRIAFWEAAIRSDAGEKTADSEKSAGYSGKRKRNTRISHGRMRRRLKRTRELISFHEAMQKLLSEEKSERRFRGWLTENRTLFAGLAEKYLKKSQMEKAFFAWLVESFDLCGKTEEDTLARNMLLLVQEPSVYCRENTLYAIYKSGSPKLVIRAYILMNRRKIRHSRKLVTDGLLAFWGDREALAEELWENWELFDAHYQVAFIDFIRMVSGRFCKRFFRLMESEADREVKFAILRYYRKYRYWDAEEMLQGYVNNWSIDDWEFAAISALALESYPGEKTVRALVRGLKSDIWHVRNNSADSLLAIVGVERQQEILGQMEDSFGRNMLEYKMESRKKRDEAVRELEEEEKNHNGND